MNVQKRFARTVTVGVALVFAASLAFAQDSPAPEMKGEGQGHKMTGRAMSDRDWWPNQLDLSRFSIRTRSKSDPLGPDFDYSAEFAKLDLEALKKDIDEVLDRLAGLVAGRLG